MDRAALEARIADLEAQRERTIATVNVINGAIEDCKYWLSVIDQPTPAETAPATQKD
jgi:hypothetical protein